MGEKGKKKIENMEIDKIKVVVQTFDKVEDTDNIITLKQEDVTDVRKFFENEFNGLICDNCKEKSKGTVIVGINTENRSAMLDYTDFCCFDFREKARKTPR